MVLIWKARTVPERVDMWSPYVILNRKQQRKNMNIFESDPKTEWEFISESIHHQVGYTSTHSMNQTEEGRRKICMICPLLNNNTGHCSYWWKSLHCSLLFSHINSDTINNSHHNMNVNQTDYLSNMLYHSLSFPLCNNIQTLNIFKSTKCLNFINCDLINSPLLCFLSSTLLISLIALFSDTYKVLVRVTDELPRTSKYGRIREQNKIWRESKS